jgi:hypothetical protein
MNSSSRRRTFQKSMNRTFLLTLFNFPLDDLNSSPQISEIYRWYQLQFCWNIFGVSFNNTTREICYSTSFGLKLAWVETLFLTGFDFLLKLILIRENDCIWSL